MPKPTSALPLALLLVSAVALRANEPAPAPVTTPASTPAPAAAAPAPAHYDADLAKRLAETEDKLATALRSYAILQTENDELKAAASRDHAAVQAAADKTIAETQTTAARTTSDALAQAQAARDEVRQLQSQVANLAAENAQLKTRLALVGPPPGSVLATPTRPGTAAAQIQAEPPAPAPAPEPPPARFHTVAIGDTLGKISKQYYGTPARWEEILRANTDIIRNENSIPLGAKLRIP